MKTAAQHIPKPHMASEKQRQGTHNQRHSFSVRHAVPRGRNQSLHDNVAGAQGKLRGARWTYRDCVFRPQLCAASPWRDPSSSVCIPSLDRYLLVFPGGGPVRVRFAGTGCFAGRWRLSVERDGRLGLSRGMSDKEGKGEGGLTINE
jgi:hypothetical protein